jgi:hypothetical protein
MFGYSPTSFPNGTGIKIGVCAGGTAGDHTLVGGIEENDAIQQVLRITLSSDELSSAAVLTSEFTDPCESDDTISNSGGTNTTGAILVCIFADADAGEDSL